MIRKSNMFISDNGNYFVQGTDTMVKNYLDAERVLIKLGIREEPTDIEEIKFLNDLELYFYGNKNIGSVSHKGKDNKQILKDLDL